MKKHLVVAFAVASITSGIVQVAVADDDFYGIVESRPDGKVGTWTVGGRSVEVTESTDLDEDNGPLKTGTCADVDIDEGKAEEIESAPAGKCSK